MKIQSQKLGRIAFDASLVRQEPDLISRFFAHIRFLPYKIEPIIQHGTVDYMGYSPAFNDIPPGGMILRYTADITTNKVTKEMLDFTKRIPSQ